MRAGGFVDYGFVAAMMMSKKKMMRMRKKWPPLCVVYND